MANEEKSRYPSPEAAKQSDAIDTDEARVDPKDPKAVPTLHDVEPEPERTPGEQHRGGPLPNEKK